jgi:hypothetical protein
MRQKPKPAGILEASCFLKEQMLLALPPIQSSSCESGDAAGVAKAILGPGGD